MTITRFIKTIIALSVTSFALTTPALAHEGSLGDMGPFRIEMITPDPSGVETRWGNGEVEFHVEPGTSVVVIGLEKEEMVKVDADGNMFFNENSPSWWNNQPQGEIPDTASSSAAPNWVWKMGGGSMQFHDHRFHFMDNSINPSTTDGSVVFEFGLPIVVNGESTELRGTMVFDSTIDPASAELLKENASKPVVTAEAPTGSQGGSGTNSLALAASLVAAAAVAGVAVVVFKRR